MMDASVFRTALLCTAVAVTACGGCDEPGKDGDPWRLADDIGMDATRSEDTDGTRDLGGTPDLAPDAYMPIDIGQSEDLGTEDVGGPREVTVVGWYTTAFEHSGFIPDPDGELTLGDRPCTGYLQPPEGTEDWWVLGLPTVNGFIDQLDATGARMRVTGTLSELGEHGHLGNYDRELEVIESERLSCETAALGGHCLRPLRSDQCVVPAINAPDATQRATLEVTYPGIGPSAVTCELHVIFNEDVADGRTDAVVRWAFPLDADAVSDPTPASELTNPSLQLQIYGEAYEEIDYDQLDGWISYSEGDADGYYVSVSGVSPSGEPLHIWGWFDVTDRHFLP